MLMHWSYCSLPLSYRYGMTMASTEYKSDYIDSLMQKRRNSIANVLELGLFCIKPSIWTHKRQFIPSSFCEHLREDGHVVKSFYCYSSTSLTIAVKYHVLVSWPQCWLMTSVTAARTANTWKQWKGSMVMKRIYKNEITSSCVVWIFFVFPNMVLQNEIK